MGVTVGRADGSEEGKLVGEDEGAVGRREGTREGYVAFVAVGLKVGDVGTSVGCATGDVEGMLDGDRVG